MASNTVIRTNVLALNSHRNLGMVGVAKEKSSAKLSSGYRINSAADDAAGLAISEKMRSQIRGLDMANKNTQDGISLIQTAEGGMAEVDNMVQRIRELVNYASNDTNDQANTVDPQGDRQKIQDEIDQLLEEIDSMASRVEFNKKTLIDGSYSVLGKASKTARETASTSIYTAQSTLLSSHSTAQSTLTSSLVTAKSTYDSAAAVAQKTFDDAPTAANAQSTLDAALVAAKSTYDSSNVLANSNFDSSYNVNTATANKSISDAYGTLAAAGTGGKDVWFQLGANAKQGFKLSIGSVTTDALGLGVGLGKAGKTIDIMQTTGLRTTDLLNRLDKALTVVTTERSKLGAAQNRLEFTGNSLQISSENLSAAESRVRNTDMGKEMMSLTQANILQQASISMLAQGNQQPQSILQLLQ